MVSNYEKFKYWQRWGVQCNFDGTFYGGYRSLTTVMGGWRKKRAILVADEFYASMMQASIENLGGCNSMQWRFFLDHLPRHLHWKHLIQTDSILGSNTLYFDQSFMSLLFCCFFLHEFNLIIYNKQV